MIKLARRAQALKASPTLALAAKAKELLAQGKPVLSLSVGEPDWDTFSAIKIAGIAAIEAGQTKYAPAAGIPELRRAIAHQTSLDLNMPFGEAEVVVTAGAKMVIFGALQVLVEEGDEVLIPAPYWVSYPAMVELAGATPKIVPGDLSKNGRLTKAQLEPAITSQTKLLILNSPSNPTGEVHTREELMGLAEVLRKHQDIIVLSDDIYNRLVFDGSGLAPHILQVAPDLRDRVVVVNGASKSLSMTGWRLGWAVGPKLWMAALSNYLSQSVSCASPFTQKAALEGFTPTVDAEVRRSVDNLIRRRDRTLAKLREIAWLKVATPGGAFYLWPDISRTIGKSYRGQIIDSDATFCRLLLEHEHIAVVPGGEFGGPGFIRMSFVVSELEMDEALSRLKRFCDEIQ